MLNQMLKAYQAAKRPPRRAVRARLEEEAEEASSEVEVLVLKERRVEFFFFFFFPWPRTRQNMGLIFIAPLSSPPARGQPSP